MTLLNALPDLYYLFHSDLPRISRNRTLRTVWATYRAPSVSSTTTHYGLHNLPDSFDAPLSRIRANPVSRLSAAYDDDDILHDMHDTTDTRLSWRHRPSNTLRTLRTVDRYCGTLPYVSTALHVMYHDFYAYMSWRYRPGDNLWALRRADAYESASLPCSTPEPIVYDAH
ncbi:hypothetical protein Dda_1805 [Drechslerella dactyloides]|uniref:Uncharacterized protein n=1 Tax=Drechslerella dactyloides TaxID=74499 RepID=A0AAD6NLS0_DREDA|nr:hypothetical protein Dda_1805 [Drechslerella dactyloides]